MKRHLLIALFTGFVCILNAQPAVEFKKHISYLASDKLHGRFTGTKDEKLAAQYIIQQFKDAHITNVKGGFGKGKYLQTFHYHPLVDSIRTNLKGHNVIAYIDNHAPYTVIMGAHYDHLGMGDPHYSRYRGTPAVHNGADDNASGVAMIIELGKKLKDSPYKNNNYLIIAFSGEEEGLLGSKWFTSHPLIELSKVDYMLNYDMVGRVDSNKFIVNGVGTSSAWNDALAHISTPLHVKTTESGVGPSDHTSFYFKDIPVLHFFSGQHKDYHMPTDDEDKINYQGMTDVFNYTMQLIAALDKKGKINFEKTKEDNNENAPKFTVTLGVMPDYTFEGEGMRIDAVTDGKPAFKAGILAGDVVVQLGDIKVKDMMSYMKGLSQFKKGDATKVKVKRGSETIEKDIQF
jgi:acetylornithine deacetylase/succinyl-diaminopimelate desuccinylase-like protein